MRQDPTTRRLPSLTALRAFEAVARNGGFRSAARELFVTHSAVSHQVRSLEEALGLSLLRRDARPIQLTPAGAELYPALREAFGQIREGVVRARRRAELERVTLHVYTIVALRWLNERLAGFHRAHPHLELGYSDTNPGWDFDAAAADVGVVHVDGERRTDLLHVPLFEATLYPVCRAGLGATLRLADGAPAAPLVEVRRGEWRTWLDAAGFPWASSAMATRVDSYLLALEMAAAGQGIAMMNGPFARDDLRTGRVERAHDLEVRTSGEWCLVHARSRAGEPALREVCDWLVAEASADAR